jgi:D-glycero-D-manno-heptose 1,7-bisphosphate phosphatase
MDNNKYIVFDRDGTLIKHIPYLFDPDLVELKPGVREALIYFKKKGYKLFLHTNQSGIERGFFNIEDAIACNDKLIELLDLGNTIFEKICIAPNLTELACNYRKPSPLFATEIMEENNITNAQLIYIGDSICDLQTALNIGCVGLGIKSQDSHLADFVLANPSLKFFDSWIEIKNYFKQINI